MAAFGHVQRGLDILRWLVPHDSGAGPSQAYGVSVGGGEAELSEGEYHFKNIPRPSI